MPSSPNNSRRRSRQATTADGWFTAVALERIAECVAGDLPSADRTTSSIVDRYLRSDPVGEYSDLDVQDFIAHAHVINLSIFGSIYLQAS